MRGTNPLSSFRNNTHAQDDPAVNFLRYLKSNSLFKDIPVVMLSSEESTTERINLLEAGAEDFILKPFNPMELKARIKKFL